MFTQPQIVPPAPNLPVAVAPRTNRVAAALAFLVVGAMAAGLVALMLPTKLFLHKRDCVALNAERTACAKLGDAEDIEYGIVPASADAVEPRLRITGAPTPGGTGQILFVTVRQPALQLLDWMALRHNPAGGLYSREDLFGDETPQQQSQRSFRSMRTAKETAEYVAMRYAGFDAKAIEGDVLVDQIVCLKQSDRGCAEQAPLAKVLQRGDKLTSIDGKPVTTLTELRTALAAHHPGDTVAVTAQRDGKPVQGSFATLAASDDPNRAILGFLPVDTTSVQLPSGIKVDIDTNSIGGPSAGLAFTLTLIDQLTRGNLLGGKTVAVTGTIDIDGNVGPIGGLSSKASAVLQNGGTYFLVPTAQGEADIALARRVVGNDVQIIPVATLQEAIDALVKLGGDRPQPNPPAPSRPPSGAPGTTADTAPVGTATPSSTP